MSEQWLGRHKNNLNRRKAVLILVGCRGSGRDATKQQKPPLDVFVLEEK
jgi:hypothetical protein